MESEKTSCSIWKEDLLILKGLRLPTENLTQTLSRILKEVSNGKISN